MKHPISHLLGIGFWLACTAVLAQDEEKTPDRVVKEDAGQQVEEFRVEGRLESVRVKPHIGPEYFIDDRSGDGTLSSPAGGELDSQFNIRTWKLGEW